VYFIRGQRSDHEKYLAVTPFIILCLVVAAGWCTIVIDHYSPAIKNIAALVLILINLPLYFVRHTAARITTGVILLLATFSAIQLTVEVATFHRSSIGCLSFSWYSFVL